MVDWHAFSSNDLVHWKDHGVIFSLKDIPWAKKWAWAPDAMKRNGRYYFYVDSNPDGTIKPVPMTREGVKAKPPKR